jgi:hypothetical protein
MIIDKVDMLKTPNKSYASILYKQITHLIIIIFFRLLDLVE